MGEAGADGEPVEDIEGEDADGGFYSRIMVGMLRRPAVRYSYHLCPC